MSDYSPGKLAQNLVHDTGADFAITYPSGTSTRLEAFSDRVRVVVNYRRRPGSRARWDSSTLEIDGQQVALSNGYEHLVAIFADPDSHLAGKAGATLEPVPAGGDLNDAPPKVQELYGKLSDAFPGATAGCEGGRWVIGADIPAGGLRFYIVQTALGWILDRNQPLRIVLGGEDVSEAAGGDIAKALRMLLRHPGGSQPGTGPVTSGAPVRGRAKSVEVRNTTVIRD